MLRLKPCRADPSVCLPRSSGLRLPVRKRKPGTHCPVGRWRLWGYQPQATLMRNVVLSEPACRPIMRVKPPHSLFPFWAQSPLDTEHTAPHHSSKHASVCVCVMRPGFELRLTLRLCSIELFLLTIVIIIVLIGIYFNLSNSSQSAAGLKALKPAANRRYLMCKSLPYSFHVLYRSIFTLLSAKCMLGLFAFS